MSLGKSLQQNRLQAQLTQAQVAGRLFVTRQTVSRWEQDSAMPNINVLCKLSELYDVPLDDLVAQRQIKQEGNRMKKVNFIALFGVVSFNVILGVSLWIIVLSLLASLWVIVGAFILSPILFLGACLLRLQAFEWWQFGSSLFLLVVGVVLYPLTIKLTSFMVNFGKQYLKYNRKAIYH